MKFNGVESETLSAHALGMSIDMNPGLNEPSYKYHDQEKYPHLYNPRIYPGNNRGEIPDEVILALMECGFIWGGSGGAVGCPELNDDPMHLQLGVNPWSERGQAIINASRIGRECWDAVKDTLPQVG